MLNLPLWIVTEHIQPSTSEPPPRQEAGTALAFSSADKLFRFMKANIGGEWKMEMASDHPGLIILIADLHRLGIETLFLDPDLDGKNGEQVTLAELVAFAETLR